MPNRIIMGAPVRIGESEYECPNVIEQMVNEIDDDSESPEIASAIAIECYLGFTKPQKTAVDDMMAALCGWSFPTLVARCGNVSNEILEALGASKAQVEKPEEDEDDDQDDEEEDLDD